MTENQSAICIRICHLFPHAMNLYGDNGNLRMLQHRLEEMGCFVEITAFEGGEAPDWQNFDLIYLGSGTEKAQARLLLELDGQQKALKEFVEKGKMFFATGTGFELLGQYLITKEGKTLSALGLGDFSVKQSDKRYMGDVIATFLPEEMPPLIGYLNCSGIVEGEKEAFSRITFGPKKLEGTKEGFVKGKCLATHMIGPVLVRNPHLLEQIVFWLGEEKGVTPNEADNSLAKEAYARSLAGLQERDGKK